MKCSIYTSFLASQQLQTFCSKLNLKIKVENNNIMECVEMITDFPTIYKTGDITPLDVMTQSGYSKLFSLVTIENISEYLIQKPKLIDDWKHYSEDIRHSPAWGFGQNENDSWTVAYWGDGKLIEKYNYDDKFVACAKMIKMTFEEIRKH